MTKALHDSSLAIWLHECLANNLLMKYRSSTSCGLPMSACWSNGTLLKTWNHADNLPRLYVQQTGSGIYSRQNLGAPKSEATRVMENINDFVIFLLPTVVRLSWSAFIHGVCSRWAKNMFVQLSLAALICVEMATWTPWPGNQQQKKFQPPQPRNNNKVINDHVANSRACSEAQPNNATQTLRKNNVYLQTEWNTMDMQNNLF